MVSDLGINIAVPIFAKLENARDKADETLSDKFWDGIDLVISAVVY